MAAKYPQFLSKNDSEKQFLRGEGGSVAPRPLFEAAKFGNFRKIEKIRRLTPSNFFNFSKISELGSFEQRTRRLHLAGKVLSLKQK